MTSRYKIFVSCLIGALIGYLCIVFSLRFFNSHTKTTICGMFHKIVQGLYIKTEYREHTEKPQGAEEFCYSLALLCKPFILTYMTHEYKNDTAEQLRPIAGAHGHLSAVFAQATK